MASSIEHQKPGEQPDLLDMEEPAIEIQDTRSQSGTLSASESIGHEHEHNQIPTSTPATTNEAQQAEDAPTLPPRPVAATTNAGQGAMATDHIVDQLPPPTIDNTTAPPPDHANPTVDLLKGMFPDFDDAVLESVLASVENNQEAAVDILLGMSDPSYVSTQQPQTQANPANPSIDLDEQLARQLALDDERQARGGRGRRPSGQSWPRRSTDERDPEVPYATRPAHPHQIPAPSQGQGQGQGQGGDFQEIKETFNQIAESGKRTFSSIFSKVKAKIDEYDQKRPQASRQDQPPPSWGNNGSSSQYSQEYDPNLPSNAQQTNDPATYPNYYSGDGRTPGGPMDRHAASQYYAAGAAQGDNGWTRVGGGRGARGQRMQTQEPQFEPPMQAPAPVTAQKEELRGYDLGSNDAPDVPPEAPKPLGQPPSIPEPSEPTGAVDAAVPRPPTTQSGSPLNAAKFGLLPKRPVSLLTPQASAQRHPDEEDDEDELDYVENPFEEKRK